MIAVITLFISLVGLIVNIIINRDKLKVFIQDLGKWQQQQIEKKKAANLIQKYKVFDYDKQKTNGDLPVRTLFAMYTYHFFLSLGCSAIISFFDIPSWRSLGWGFFAITFLLWVFIRLFSLNLLEKVLIPTTPINIGFSIFAIIMTVEYIYMWGVFTLLAAEILPPLYAGVTSSINLYIIAWLVEKRIKSRA